MRARRRLFLANVMIPHGDAKTNHKCCPSNIPIKGYRFKKCGGTGQRQVKCHDWKRHRGGSENAGEKSVPAQSALRCTSCCTCVLPRIKRHRKLPDSFTAITHFLLDLLPIVDKLNLFSINKVCLLHTSSRWLRQPGPPIYLRQHGRV